jgi:hypothetical protein
MAKAHKRLSDRAKARIVALACCTILLDYSLVVGRTRLVIHCVEASLLLNTCVLERHVAAARRHVYTWMKNNAREKRAGCDVRLEGKGGYTYRFSFLLQLFDL